MKSHIDELRDQRFIPMGSVEHRHDDLDLVYYSTRINVGDQQERPIIAGYEGRRIKPLFHIRFQSDNRADEYIRLWVEGRKNAIQAQQARREKAKAFKTSLKSGSILSSSWGWEQTNVEFWQVIEKKSDKTVVIQEIMRELSPEAKDHEYNGMAGKVIPRFDVFMEGSKPVVKRVTEGDCIRLDSCRRLTPWDGKPQYCSWYA